MFCTPSLFVDYRTEVPEHRRSHRNVLETRGQLMETIFEVRISSASSMFKTLVVSWPRCAFNMDPNVSRGSGKLLECSEQRACNTVNSETLLWNLRELSSHNTVAPKCELGNGELRSTSCGN